MSQGQSPETEVGGRVRNAAEHVLDRVDGLVDHHVTEGLEFTRAFRRKQNAYTRIPLHDHDQRSLPLHFPSYDCR